MISTSDSQAAICFAAVRCSNSLHQRIQRKGQRSLAVQFLPQLLNNLRFQILVQSLFHFFNRSVSLCRRPRRPSLEVGLTHIPLHVAGVVFFIRSLVYFPGVLVLNFFSKTICAPASRQVLLSSPGAMRSQYIVRSPCSWRNQRPHSRHWRGALPCSMAFPNST